MSGEGRYADSAYTSWAHKHVAENPGHRAQEGLYDPGSCDDCSERSPIYNLVTAPATPTTGGDDERG